MWLAAPFFFTGRIALQNLFWTALFVGFLARYFCKCITAWSFVLLFLLASLGNLNDLAVGGDYVTNVLYVAIALSLFAEAVNFRTSKSRLLLAVVLFGITLSSRILYVVSIPPILAFALQRTRPRRALLMLGGSLLTAISVTVPVFWPHPLVRLLAQLQQNSDKLRVLPSSLSGPVLPFAALALASTAFFCRMDLRRVFLLSGVASLVLILPPMAIFIRAQGGFLHPLTVDLEYFAVSALFLALWAFAGWENAAIHPGQSPNR